MSAKPIELVLRVVGDARRQRDGFVSRCPAHEDRSPSLRIAEDRDGKVLIKCRAGCPTAVVLQKLGLQWRDLFPRNDAGEIRRPAPRRSFEIPDPPAPDPKWKKIARQCWFQAGSRRDLIPWLARKLGVWVDSLIAIRCGWIGAEQLAKIDPDRGRKEAAYTFPERDGRGRVVGISLRWPDGEKGFISGGYRGLTIPAGFHTTPGLAVCVEGQSDTAALHTMGIAGIGRPSNTGGADALARILRRRDAVIVGENDAKPPTPKHPDGSWPGRVGAVTIAEKLQAYWKRPVFWTLPPADCKDVREYLHKRGGSADFLADVMFEVIGGSKQRAELESLRRAKVKPEEGKP